jgi:hypothetical protein
MPAYDSMDRWASGTKTRPVRRRSDPETEYVAFDRPCVLRLPARIITDLDELAGDPPIGAESRAEGKAIEVSRWQKVL